MDVLKYTYYIENGEIKSLTAHQVERAQQAQRLIPHLSPASLLLIAVNTPRQEERERIRI